MRSVLSRAISFKAIHWKVCLFILLVGYILLGCKDFISTAESHTIVICKKPECVQDMINKLGCPLCHTIPGVEGAVGELGPPLHQKIDAAKRIKGPRYKGKARTAREYVKESILNPDVYIVFDEKAGEFYPEGVMPSNYIEKIPPESLELLIDFIANTQPQKNDQHSPR